MGYKETEDGKLELKLSASLFLSRESPHKELFPNLAGATDKVDGGFVVNIDESGYPVFREPE